MKKPFQIAINIVALFSIILNALIGFAYFKSRSDPFAYNDFAREHKWLPLTIEPKLEVFSTFEDTSRFLDMREYEDYFYWSTKNECWETVNGCIGTYLMFSNPTQNIFFVSLDNIDGIDVFDKCVEIVRDDFIREGRKAYWMYPGCSMAIRPSTDNSVHIEFREGIPWGY